MALKVQKVANEHDALSRYLMREQIANALALYDLKFERSKTDFFVCESGNEILAYLANFRYSLGYYCALRGANVEAASKLMSYLPNARNVAVNTDPSFQRLFEEVDSKNRTLNFELEYLMTIKKGEEKPPAPIAERPVKLSPQHASEWSRIYFEGEITESAIQEARQAMHDGRVYGIITNEGKLASVASIAAKLPFAWVIVGVHTLPEYRRRGFASSVTFAATREALNNSGCSSLYVREDNYDAMRIYERMGYKKIGKSLKVSF